MMAEPRRYVVACLCGGAARALAHLDDDRPAGGTVQLAGARGAAGIVNIGARYADGSSAEHEIVSSWSTAYFSENAGERGFSWVIRCGLCPDQAQLSERTLTPVADILAAKLVADPASLPAVPVDGDEMRHLVLLGDVVRYLSRKLV